MVNFAQAWAADATGASEGTDTQARPLRLTVLGGVKPKVAPRKLPESRKGVELQADPLRGF